MATHRSKPNGALHVPLEPFLPGGSGRAAQLQRVHHLQGGDGQPVAQLHRRRDGVHHRGRTHAGPRAVREPPLLAQGALLMRRSVPYYVTYMDNASFIMPSEPT